MARVSFSWTSIAMRIMRELVSIDQAARQLVVGVGRKPVIDEELGFRIERFSVALHQAVRGEPRALPES